MPSLVDRLSKEKLPLSSKKFLAYLIADAGWKLLMGWMIYLNCEGGTLTALLAMIVVSGFVQSGYILGQAALDKYVRVAQIAAKHSESEEGKG